MAKSNDQIIYEVAIKQGFTPTAAKLVVAQARFESADYTSRIFLENNNISGMKYIGQPLAVQGEMSPEGNYYAKFKSVEDSAKDKIVRNYSITRKGVAPDQLKKVTDADEFARLLKQRGYYGGAESSYAAGLKAKLLRIEVIEFVNDNKNILLVGLGLIAFGAAFYFYTKN